MNDESSKGEHHTAKTGRVRDKLSDGDTSKGIIRTLTGADAYLFALKEGFKDEAGVRHLILWQGMGLLYATRV